MRKRDSLQRAAFNPSPDGSIIYTQPASNFSHGQQFLNLLSHICTSCTIRINSSTATTNHDITSMTLKNERQWTFPPARPERWEKYVATRCVPAFPQYLPAT